MGTGGKAKLGPPQKLNIDHDMDMHGYRHGYEHVHVLKHVHEHEHWRIN